MTARIFPPNLSISLAILLLILHSPRASPAPDLNNSSLCTINILVPSCHIAGLDLSSILQDNGRWWTWNVTEYSNSTKIVLNCSNVSTFLELDHCSCKPNYDGAKCDICADGFYSKSAIRPVLTGSLNQSSAKLNAFKHSIASTRRHSKVYDCKMCNCYSLGTKSQICDKKSGSCSCLEEYAGNKCDKCSTGHYNNSLESNLHFRGTSKRLNSDENFESGRCLKCGECFDYWYSAVMNLRDLSVDMIKKTHNLGRSSTTDLNPRVNFGGSELVRDEDITSEPGHISNEGDQFIELERKLGIISGLVLSKKQSSDRLTSLSNEFNTITGQLIKMKTNFHGQKGLKINLISNLTRLNMRLTSEAHVVEDLKRLIRKKYHLEQIEDQRAFAEVAFEKIKRYRDRSHHLVQDSLDCYHKYQVDLKKLQKELETKISTTKRKQASLESYYSNLIEKSMSKSNLDIPSNLDLMTSIRAYLYSSDAQMDFSESIWEKGAEVAQKLVDWIDQQVKAYVHFSKDRIVGLDFVEQVNLETGILMNQTISQLMNFHVNVTTALYELAQLRDPSGNNNNSSSDDILQMLENRSEMLRLCLDISDAKWISSKLYLSDLISLNTGNNVTKKFLEIYKNINRILEANSAELKNITQNQRIEIEGFLNLDNEVEMMLIALQQRNDNLTVISQFEQCANLTLTQTKAMNIQTQEDMSNLRLNLDLEIEDIRSRSNQLPSQQINLMRKFASDCENCTSRLQLLENKSAKLQVRSLIERADTRRQIERSKIRMNNINMMNEHLLLDFRELLYELSQFTKAKERIKTRSSTKLGNLYSSTTDSNIVVRRLEGIFNETKQEANITDNILQDTVKRLDENSRTLDLVNGYQNLKKQLSDGLTISESLSDDFSLYEETFSHQQKMLHLLHTEMDRLTVDIRKKLEQYDRA